MKKIALILLVSIYSLATLGIGLKGFYCCGNLQSVKISLTGEKQDKSGCCKSSYQFFKVNEKHLAGDNITSPSNLFSALSFFTNDSQISSPVISQKQDFYNRTNAPPLHHGLPVYISICTFRI